jgi:predicted Na+-dependent transporter
MGRDRQGGAVNQPPPIGDIKDIVVFGLLFVAAAALANGFSVTPASVWAPIKKNLQLSVFALIGNFVILPALVIGFLLAINLGSQMKIAFGLLALVAGAPFVAWMVSLGKGNVMYGASMSFMLMIFTVAFMPLLLPIELRMMDTGISVSTWTLYKPMLLFLLLPLVLGMLYRWRHPDLAMKGATWLGPLSVMFLVVHIALMFATYWGYFIHEFGSGDIAFTVGFGLAGLLIGWVLSPPYIMSPMKAMLPQHYGTKLASEIGTAQKGSQMLICSLIFAFGRFPVAGVMALASSVVTILLILWFSPAMGKREAKLVALSGDAGATSVAPTAPSTGAQEKATAPSTSTSTSSEGSGT